MKTYSRWSRLKLALLGVVLGGLVAGGIAYAAIPGPDGVIHGCYLKKIGTLRVIDPSTQQCTRLETPISWNAQGQPGPQGPPGASPGPQAVTVNCAAGQSINQALAQTMSATQVTITIAGTCTEAVAIGRDNVKLQAASPGDGITAPAGAQSALSISRADRIFLSNLTLRGGEVGLSVSDGSSVTAQQPTIENSATSGLYVNSASFASVQGGTISGSGGTGVFAQGSAEVDLHGGTVVSGSVSQGLFGSAGIAANDGASIEAWGITVENTADDGVKVFNGGSINIGGGSLIQNNQRGGVNAMAAHVNLQGVDVRNNGADGVSGTWGSDIVLQGSTIVEDNTGHGLSLRTGSAATVNGSVVIRNNSHDGIHISDTSVASLEAANQITGNGNWGVFCAPSPAVAMITGWDPPAPSGNGSGGLSCPVAS